MVIFKIPRHKTLSNRILAFEINVENLCWMEQIFAPSPV